VVARSVVNDFVAQRKLAVVGVSRQGRKFGNFAYRTLRERGYQLFPVHPSAETLEGDRCYASLRELPEAVGGVLVAVPPPQAEQVVRDAAAVGIPRLWLQQGAASPQALRLAQECGMSVVHGECILMFAEPVVSMHRIHRWVWRVLGKLPR
jgi:uncharacterized protein